MLREKHAIVAMRFNPIASNFAVIIMNNDKKSSYIASHPSGWSHRNWLVGWFIRRALHDDFSLQYFHPVAKLIGEQP